MLQRAVVKMALAAVSFVFQARDAKVPRRPCAFLEQCNHLINVPDELLSLTLSRLEAKELCTLSLVCKRCKQATDGDDLWGPLFSDRFGTSKLLLQAHKLAGSWKELYKAKVVLTKAAQPWRKPCEYELQAALQAMIHPLSSQVTSLNSTGNTAGNTLSVMFLIDGSGSVGEEDFSCMTSFLDTAAQAVGAVPDSKLCVVQFSNDTRVEVPLGPLDKSAFDTAIANMVRMNGGTNIAAAVAKAGSLLKGDGDSGPCTRRVLVLLTDGRIDSFQAREAGQMVGRLVDEQANIGLWAFGVGRGVDSAELMRIIEGPGDTFKGLGQERYLELCVRDDAPW